MHSANVAQCRLTWQYRAEARPSRSPPRRRRIAQVGRFSVSPDSPDSPGSHRAIGPRTRRLSRGTPGPAQLAGLEFWRIWRAWGPAPAEPTRSAGFQIFRFPPGPAPSGRRRCIDSRPQSDHRAAVELVPPTRSTAYRHRDRTLSEPRAGRGAAYGTSPTSCATTTASARIELWAGTGQYPRPWLLPTSILLRGKAIAADSTSYHLRPDCQFAPHRVSSPRIQYLRSTGLRCQSLRRDASERMLYGRVRPFGDRRQRQLSGGRFGPGQLSEWLSEQARGRAVCPWGASRVRRAGGPCRARCRRTRP